MVSGCQTIAESNVISAFGGIQANPPDLASITSYSTNDPELKAYLTLLASLENDLQGVAGNEYSAKKRQEQLKRMEVSLRKSLTNNLRSESEKITFIEQFIKAEKNKPTPRNLLVIPDGANKEESNARIFISLVGDDERFESKTVSINLVYKSKSIQEMSDKAIEIIEKLRSAFSTQSEWVFTENGTKYIKFRDIDSHELMGKLFNKGADSPTISYRWKKGDRSGYFVIYLFPSLQPENSQYVWAVVVSNTTTQARK